MKKLLLLPVIAATILTLSLQTVSASSFYASGSTGIDVSYPNCTAKVPGVSFGIVGVTGGTVFSDNSCLALEAKNFTDLSLYVNTGLNASKSSAYYAQAQVGCNGDVYCAAYNYGYNAAKDAAAYASAQGVSSAKWWLDVETSNTWSKDVLQNKKSLQGEYDALVANGAVLVGVYSTTAQWQSITGSWQNNWASWGATTWTSASGAKTYCTGHQFTGGPSLLMQYKSRQSKIDQDVAC
ncbi:MAG TPA: hypothetical protein VN778_03965 [Verrucomicrobiae bacterium]|nr:hypothetical protein [Verrucomicrobiae bacterium]